MAPPGIGVGSVCKSCPLLHSKFPFDISFWTFKHKAKVYNTLQNLTINGLSQWITSCARDSTLFKNKPIINLPNPIDTRLYRPINKEFARNTLRINTPKKLISFGARGGAHKLVILLLLYILRHFVISFSVFSKSHLIYSPSLPSLRSAYVLLLHTL